MISELTKQNCKFITIKSSGGREVYKVTDDEFTNLVMVTSDELKRMFKYIS
jgi:hypothetical protein